MCMELNQLIFTHMRMWNKKKFATLQVHVPLAGGGASTFLGTGTGTFSSGTGFLGTSGTLKTSNRVSVMLFAHREEPSNFRT